MNISRRTKHRIVQEAADEAFYHSYGNIYADEQYPQQNLYEYKNYLRYAEWLSSQKDFTDFNRWFMCNRSSEEVKSYVLQHIRKRCHNYIGVHRLVLDCYKRFQANNGKSKPPMQNNRNPQNKKKSDFDALVERFGL